MAASTTITITGDRESYEVLRIPKWRRWIVQWDMSHNAVALAFFAFTSMLQIATQHFEMVYIPQELWFVMYYISCCVLSICIIIFLLRLFIFPQAIVDDFNHPRLINFFFLPVMIGPLCIITTPTYLRSQMQYIIGFYLFAVYQLVLTLYLFGEWLFGTNPTNFIHPLVFMQTIGFFLVANVGAQVHQLDASMALFSVGALFWLLVFFTNFQHVSIALDKHSERPKATFFLFIAPPAQASLTFVILEIARQAKKSGNVDTFLILGMDEEWPSLAQALMYIDLFLYMLMFRLFVMFWKDKFSVAWWAYIFPLSAAAGMTIWRYKSEGGMFWGVIAALLSVIACSAMLVVLCCAIWSIGKGQTPNNPQVLHKYQQYFLPRALPDIDAQSSIPDDDNHYQDEGFAI